MSRWQWVAAGAFVFGFTALRVALVVFRGDSPWSLLWLPVIAMFGLNYVGLCVREGIEDEVRRLEREVERLEAGSPNVRMSSR